MTLKITDIQRFCMHDGDGIRTTVFLKGCPLRCEWCHNPETQSAKQQLCYYKNKCINCGICLQCKSGARRFEEKHLFDAAKCIDCGFCYESCPTKAIEKIGTDMEIADIVSKVSADRAFYGQNGGITVSGGEPMMQASGVLELLQRCKAQGINTAMETCGYFDGRYLEDAVKYTDVFLWDIKDTDEERHKKHTGVSNRKILENLFAADEMGARTVLRCILVNGVNTDENHFESVAEIYGRLKNCISVEWIPYHTYGGTKNEALYGADNGRSDWIPDSEVIFKAKKRFLI